MKLFSSSLYIAAKHNNFIRSSNASYMLVKRQKREAAHSHPSDTEDKKDCNVFSVRPLFFTI
jgi:hypothetical protein